MGDPTPSGLDLPLIYRIAEIDGRSASEDDVREAMRADVETLLNAHRRFLPAPAHLQYAAGTMLSFGVPDFSNEGYSTKDHKERLRLEIERAIAQHEPRLRSVRVELIESSDGDVLRFRISAQIRLAEHSEPVAFSTSIEPVDWSVKVDSPE